MLHVAIVTLALLSGECPECGHSVSFYPPSWYGYKRQSDYGPAGVYGPDSVTWSRLGYKIGTPWTTRPIVPRAAIAQTIPRPIVGCVGQNCYSSYRPPVPGIPSFDYRTDFNYPWSQTPCALYPRHGDETELDLPYPGGPEEIVSPPALEVSRKSKAPQKLKRATVLAFEPDKSAKKRR